MPGPRRGTVLVTGVGRRRSIGAGLAVGLAEDGWDLFLNYWAPYDDRAGYPRGEHDSQDVAAECRRRGARVAVLPADLAEAGVPARLVAAAAAAGGLRGLVMSHCESADSSILTTTVESWDRHFQVNARAAWLLIKAFAGHLPAGATTEVRGRIVALTSDHTAHNLPYRASKGALDRIVVAAAAELGGRGIRANVINPGPVDTGWMTPRDRPGGSGPDPVQPARHARRHRRPGAIPHVRCRRLDHRSGPLQQRRDQDIRLRPQPASGMTGRFRGDA